MRAVALGLALAAGPAWADPAALAACLAAAERDPAAEADCAGVQAAACLAARPEGETPAGLAICAAAEAEAWAVVVNEAHGTVVALVRGVAQAEDPEATAPGPREVLLQRAQAAWAAFREADCAEEAAGWGEGPMREAAAAQCRLAMNAERARALLAKRRAHEAP